MKKISKFLVFTIVTSLLIGVMGISGFTAEKKSITLKVQWFPTVAYDNFLELQSENPRKLTGWLAYEWIANLFARENPNIKLEFMPGISQSKSEPLLTALAGGTAPCWYYAPQDNMESVISKGLAADITDYVKDWEGAKKIPSTLWEPCWRNGRCYGVIRDLVSSMSVAYRKDWFKEAGIFNAKGDPAVPDNWTTKNFTDIAIKLTDVKKKRWGWAITSTSWGAGWFTGEIWSVILGIPRTVPDKTFKYTWRCSPAEEWAKPLQFLKDLLWTHKCALGGMTYDFGTAYKEFDGGRAGMSFKMNGTLKTYALNEGKPGYLWASKVGVAPFPIGAGDLKYGDYWTNYFVMNPTLSKEEKDAAWKLQDYCFMNGEGRQTFVNMYGQAGIAETTTTVYSKLPENVAKLIPAEWGKVIDEDVIGIPVGPVRSVGTAAGYNVPLRNWNIMKDHIGNAVEAIVSDSKADPLKIAQDMKKKIDSVVLNYKAEETTKEDFKRYYTALGEYYQKNFPEYYKEYFLGYLEKYYKIW